MSLLGMIKKGIMTIAKDPSVVKAIGYTMDMVVKSVVDTASIYIPKFDLNDIKSMIYRYNLNNECQIDKEAGLTAHKIILANDFLDAYNAKYDTTINMDNLITQLAEARNNEDVLLKYSQCTDPRLLLMNNDAFNTSGLVDTREINKGCGGIYVPGMELQTDEGQFVADNKNLYLEELQMAEDMASKLKAIRDYHERNKTNEVNSYFI